MLGIHARACSVILLLGCTPTESQNLAEPATEAPPATIAEPDPERPPDPEPAASEAASEGFVVRMSDPVPEPGSIPKLERHEPVVGVGPMPPEVIRRVVRSHITELRDCYALGLAKDPQLAGPLAIEFTIGPSGAVEDAKAEDVTRFGDPDVARCIVEAISGWQFPEPRGGGRITVSYPFHMDPA